MKNYSQDIMEYALSQPYFELRELYDYLDKDGNTDITRKTVSWYLTKLVESGKLHRVAHGDTLVELLKLMIKAILTHIHPYAGMPPTIHSYTKEMAEYEVDKILSKHVRVS